MGTTGTMVENLIDFNQRFPTEAAAMLAGFTGTNFASTTKLWLSGQQVPTGERRVKTLCFLYLSGYKTKEFEEDVRPIGQRLGLLIATGITSVDAVQQELEYSDPKGVFDILLRGHTPLREKQFRMERLVKNQDAELKARIKEWKFRLKELRLPSAPLSEAVETVVKGLEDMVLSPISIASSDSSRPVPSPPPTTPKRKRKRTHGGVERSKNESQSARTSKMLMHLVSALAVQLEGMPLSEVSDQASLLSRSISSQAIEVSRNFLSIALERR